MAKASTATKTMIDILRLTNERDEAMKKPVPTRVKGVGVKARSLQNITVDEIDDALAPQPCIQDITHLVQSGHLVHPVTETGEEGGTGTTNEQAVTCTDKGRALLSEHESGKAVARPDPGPASLRQVDRDPEFKDEKRKPGRPKGSGKKGSNKKGNRVSRNRNEDDDADESN